MNYRLARSLPLLLLLAALVMPVSLLAQSSPTYVPPFQLYRFRISASDLGYILTHNYQQGINLGFTYDGIAGAIYPIPAPGYTPDPSSGLYPLHRWTVVESGWRVYTYYSIYYFPHGSNYTYDGIIGYVFPPAATSHTFDSGVTATLHHLSIFYSQRYGFWNGVVLAPNGFTYPPSGAGFYYQGLIAAFPNPTAGTGPGPNNPFSGAQPYSVLFNPPPPPPTCDPVDEQSCYDNGGSWDSSTCYCGGYTDPWGCDPTQEQNCSNYGGYWNSMSCTCEIS